MNDASPAKVNHCVDCFFFEPDLGFTDKTSRVKHARCTHRSSFRTDEAYRAYLVSGQYSSANNYMTMCSIMRAHGHGACGYQGTLFQPRPSRLTRRQSVLGKIRSFTCKFFSKPPYP